MIAALGFSDEELCASLARRLQLIRDYVRGVAGRFHTAAYLVGRPGTGKTFTVRQELERLEVSYVLKNSRITSLGLFRLIAEHPEEVIVLDDVSTVFSTPMALQILMAALDGTPGENREVCYKTAEHDFACDFAGGIIAISNVPLHNDPLANAVRSRCVQLEHEPTDDEIEAFIRRLCRDGYKDLSAAQCREVADVLIEETRSNDRRLDLRHLNKSLEFRRQTEHGVAESDWQDLLKANLGRVFSARESFSKQEVISAQREKVRQALVLFPNDPKRQIEWSGLRKSTFYVRRKEL